MRPPLLVECRVKCEQWCCSKPGRRYTAAVPCDCWVKLVDTSGLGSLTVAGEPDWLVSMCPAQVTVFVTRPWSNHCYPFRQNNETIHPPGHCLVCQLSVIRKLNGSEGKAKIIIPLTSYVDEILLRYSPDWFHNAVQPFNMFSLEAQVRNGCFEWWYYFQACFFFFFF